MTQPCTERQISPLFEMYYSGSHCSEAKRCLFLTTPNSLVMPLNPVLTLESNGKQMQMSNENAHSSVRAKPGHFPGRSRRPLGVAEFTGM